MKMGEGRRAAGGRQGAARRETELPGAEEWLRAEEGALELNFLSPRWGWDLCCHLQGDAGCAAAGILMAREACGRGLRGHPKPPLGQAVGSEDTLGAAPVAATEAVSFYGGQSSPGLAVGEQEDVEGWGTVNPPAAVPTAGDRAALLLAASVL